MTIKAAVRQHHLKETLCIIALYIIHYATENTLDFMFLDSIYNEPSLKARIIVKLVSAIMRKQKSVLRGEAGGGVSVIGIDGPVAAGKTVVGRALAKSLGFNYLDTGIMYRAITWLALHLNIPIDDEEALGKLAKDYPLRLADQDNDQVLVGDHQVGPELREPRVNTQVSLVARISAVRQALVHQQRLLATQGDIVMIGRDIGTVVLPDADLKVFLDASAESRARRRWLEMTGQGHTLEFQQVLRETKARDEIDTGREDSPLTPAKDAFVLDTEELGVEEVVSRILMRIQELSEAGQS